MNITKSEFNPKQLFPDFDPTWEMNCKDYEQTENQDSLDDAVKTQIQQLL